MGLLTVMLPSLLTSLVIGQALPPSDCTVDGPDMLTCSLSSINSRLERTDFSVIPNTTVSLSVVCTQPDVGSLPPAAFSSLTKLSQLSLKGCVLDFLPARVFQGLSSLVSLQVSTNSPAPLRLEQDSLIHLPSLTKLDLSSSSVRSLPSRQLCSDILKHTKRE